MKKSGSIKNQILIVIILSILIPPIILIIVSAIRFQKFSIELAQKNMEKVADEYAAYVKYKLDGLFVAVSTYEQILNHNIKQDKSINFTKKQLSGMQNGFLKANTDVLRIYTEFNDLNILKNDTFLSSNKIPIISNLSKKYSVKPAKFYYNIDSLKQTNNNEYIFSSKPYTKDSLLTVSCAKGIFYDNQLMGLVGIDFDLNWIQNFTGKISLYDNAANVCIVAGNNVIVGSNKHKELIGSNISLLKDITNTEKKYLYLNTAKFISENKVFSYIIPVKMRNNDVWHVKISVPEKVILKDSTTNLIMRIILVFIMTVVVVAIAIFVLNKIISRIVHITDAAQKISQGNIDVQFEKTGNDELTILAGTLQFMMKKIKEIIINVKSNSNELYLSSKELSNIAVKLAEGASEQASSTEEVSSSMEEMTATVIQNSDNAKVANKIASKSATDIELSSRNVVETSKSMEEIANKTSIIGDIAFKTNILALNAAVEAARAGQFGKGFGVVAAEVGKLADNSKKAANEIDNLTKKSFSIAEKSGELLEKIAPEIKKTAQLVQEIASSNMEQKINAEQINKAVQQLNTVTQENVQSAEFLAANVEALNALSEKLNKDIEFFKTKDLVLKYTNKITPLEQERKDLTEKEKHQDNKTSTPKGITLNLDDETLNDNEFEKF